ncbi:MAG: efflux RND transporter permease subunit, partial [Bacteroidota bacterium]|nr:efflux RND transporter permease subunit [Bacteroidota bacterium]
AAMYVAFRDEQLSPIQLYEFVNREVIPRLMALPEVDQITPSGASETAMRIRLKPQAMATHGVAAEDIALALNDNNFLSASGYLKTNMIQIFSKSTSTTLSTPDEFKRIIVASSTGGSPIYLEDVAEVEYGAYNEEQLAKFNGEQGIVLPIFNTPNSNVMTVMDRVKDELESIKPSLPKSMESFIVYDSTIAMQESIDEVIYTIFEASIIVIFVIFLFLGSIRATCIPIVTIPLSLAGACIGIMVFGFSINTLTLLALVLAIGLVVDDAIVVIENIQRHMEEGMPTLEASKLGASTIIGSIIAMTITLAAVFAPLGLSSGITGALFAEFAFTLAFSVVVSGVVSLILSPMMCSKILS